MQRCVHQIVPRVVLHTAPWCGVVSGFCTLAGTTLASQPGLHAPRFLAQLNNFRIVLDVIATGRNGESTSLRSFFNTRYRSCFQPRQDSSNFTMQILRLRGVTVCCNSGVTEALQYAQVHLQQFQGEFMPQIKQLMGRLLYSHRALDETPYGHLHQDALLEDVATDFTKATCRILGQVCCPRYLAPYLGTVLEPSIG